MYCSDVYKLYVIIADDVEAYNSRRDSTETGLLTQDEVYMLYEDVSKSNSDGSLTPNQNGEFGEVTVTKVTKYGSGCYDWITCSWGGRTVLVICSIVGVAILLQGAVIVWDLISGRFVCYIIGRLTNNINNIDDDGDGDDVVDVNMQQ